MNKKRQEKEAKELIEKKKLEKAALAKQEVAKRNAEQIEQRKIQKSWEELLRQYSPTKRDKRSFVFLLYFTFIFICMIFRHV